MYYCTYNHFEFEFLYFAYISQFLRLIKKKFVFLSLFKKKMCDFTSPNIIVYFSHLNVNCNQIISAPK